MLKYFIIKRKMKKHFKKVILFFILSLAVSCSQNVKDGLTGKKQNNSDEFLIKKKTPLILPPDYNSLPEPKTANSKDQQKNIKEILEIKSDTKNKVSTTTSKNVLLEESVLKKIKNR